MSYLTAQGVRVEYPLTLRAKALKTSNEDILQIVNETHKIFKCLQDADYELITLREDNKRLKHENEFMIKLINLKETHD